MTVAELIAHLKTMPQEHEVLLENGKDIITVYKSNPKIEVDTPDVVYLMHG